MERLRLRLLLQSRIVHTLVDPQFGTCARAVGLRRNTPPAPELHRSVDFRAHLS